MQRLLTFDDLVAAGYIANRVTLNRRIRRGEFPAPIRISSRNVAWLKREIDEWEADRIENRNRAPRRSTSCELTRASAATGRSSLRPLVQHNGFCRDALDDHERQPTPVRAPQAEPVKPQEKSLYELLRGGVSW